MKGLSGIILLSFVLFTTVRCFAQPQPVPKKIVLLAGKKSHGPGDHEYIKSVRLLKVMLDRAPNLEGLTTEIHYNGWPEDPATLDDADLILVISDGQDGDLFSPVPFMTPERMAVMEKQMKRGCGYAAIHFSTFADDFHGEKILDWGGGYFDWQDDEGARNWYSAIKTLDAQVKLTGDKHPVTNGVSDFDLHEEFYYNIRFNPSDPRLVPVARVPALETDRASGRVVAWAIDREDGGRGFCTTMGHFFENWKNDHYRKLLLNGIVWAAGMTVPEEGVVSQFYNDRQVTEALFGATVKGLILTGNHHPAHLWRETTPVLREALENDVRIHVDVSTDIADLQQYDLNDYDFLMMNYCNWEDPEGLSDQSKKAFVQYLSEGGGLILVHFANGAFHFSLPGAGESDWPEYREICRRVWDHQGGSGHDKYGAFMVSVTDATHPLTKGLSDFETVDELYYRQRGDTPVAPLLTARSKDTGEEEPLAWTYTYGKGKVFQILLGHGVESLRTPEVMEIIKRAGTYVADK